MDVAAAEKVTRVPDTETTVVPAGNGPVTTMPGVKAAELATVAMVDPKVVVVATLVLVALGMMDHPLRLRVAVPVLEITYVLLAVVPETIDP